MHFNEYDEMKHYIDIDGELVEMSYDEYIAYEHKVAMYYNAIIDSAEKVAYKLANRDYINGKIEA